MEATLTRPKTLKMPSLKSIFRIQKRPIRVLFLDIDGVVNSEEWFDEQHEKRGTQWGKRFHKKDHIDPYKAHLVRHIVESTDCKVVLSSTWRLFPDDRDLVRKKVVEFMDVTPRMPRLGGAESMERGYEIKAWLNDHPHVERYAILDDDSDMLPEQIPHFFKTTWQKGLTDDIARDVITHLNTW